MSLNYNEEIRKFIEEKSGISVSPKELEIFLQEQKFQKNQEFITDKILRIGLETVSLEGRIFLVASRRALTLCFDRDGIQNQLYSELYHFLYNAKQYGFEKSLLIIPRDFPVEKIPSEMFTIVDCYWFTTLTNRWQHDAKRDVDFQRILKVLYRREAV